MSELKVHKIGDLCFDFKMGKDVGIDFYLKSEADKVIAELKKERDWLAKDRAQAYNDLEKRAQLNIKQEESNRHNKYKRCLAMAERCKYRMYYLSAVIDYESSKLVPNPTAVKRHMKKESRMDFWKNRWLKLADKFKEDK